MYYIYGVEINYVLNSVRYVCILAPNSVHVNKIVQLSVQFCFLHKKGVPNLDTMYNRILSLCDAKGIKPGKVCSETGLSRGMMTDLKMGRTKELSIKNTKIIADYFGVSVDYLLTGENVTGNDKKPAAPEGDELDAQLIKMLTSLRPEEIEKVADYVSILIKARED